MMKKILYCTLTLLVFSMARLHAQASCEKAVAAAAEKLRLAMLDGNEKALQTIAHKKLSYGHSSGHVEQKDEFIKKLATKQSDFVSIQINDQVIVVAGKTAIVRHVLSAQTNDNNKPGQVNLKVMLVFAKKGGDWKLLARQAVKVIQANKP